MHSRHAIVAFATAFALLSGSLAHAQQNPSAGDSAAANATTHPTKKQQRADNRKLSKAVRQSLTETKTLDVAGITVVARGGKVTLSGSVPAANQIQIATDAAQATQGVAQIDNRLTIREPGH
jgi:osmotically-inducible protein OsmY